jgi:hypothetical protein
MKTLLNFNDYINENVDIIPSGPTGSVGPLGYDPSDDDIKKMVDDADDNVIDNIVDYIRDILLKQEQDGKISNDTTDKLDDKFEDWKEWIKEAIDTIDFDNDELKEIIDILGGEKYESDFVSDFDEGEFDALTRSDEDENEKSDY